MSSSAPTNRRRKADRLETLMPKFDTARCRHGLRTRRSGPRRFDAGRRAVRKLRGRTDPSPAFDLIFCFRTGTAAERVLRPVYFGICDFKYVSQHRPIETPLVRTSPENEIARPQKTAQSPLSVDAQAIHR